MSCFREQRSLRLCLCGVISFLVLLSPSFHATRTAVAAAVSLLVARLFPSFTHAGTRKMAERPVATTSSHLLALLVSTRDLAYAAPSRQPNRIPGCAQGKTFCCLQNDDLQA